MSRYAAGKRLPRPAVMARIVAASGGRIQPNDLFGEPVPAADPFAGYAVLDLVIADLAGVMRGKKVRAGYGPTVLDKGVNITGSLFSLDSVGENVEASGLVMSAGDGDRLLRPADGVVRPVPWATEPTGQLLMTMFDADGAPFYGDPRHVLRAVVARFADLGLTPVVALEPEFYLVDRERDAAGYAQPATSPRSGRRREVVQVYSFTDLEDHAAFFSDVHAACAAQGLSSGATIAEYGSGQFEVNLTHGDDAVAAADHCVLLKRLIKGVARRHGFEATFMAKPFAEQAGSGLHVHVSLRDRHGRNVFATNGESGGVAPALRHAIGGLRALMPESLALLAPNANSYRRFRPGSYAPMAPTWGVDNRTVALRVPLGPPDSARVEHRVAGADANPYLTLAAVLAGIHHGLTRQLDPGEPMRGNAYKQTAASLPTRWAAALDAFDGAAVLPDYFGRRFMDLYSVVRRTEMERFEAVVTPLEHRWYLTEL